MQAALDTHSRSQPDETLEGLRPTELPAPPDVALRVMQACASPDSDTRGIAELVTADPVLTAELLRIVNSAFFGFAGKVTSVAQAVTILGQKALRHYALCIATRDALGKDALHGNDVEGFWRASLTRAVAARLLAEVTDRDPDECFTAGLLLDIGLAALFHARPDLAGHWERFLRADPASRLQLERDAFGMTHDRAGAILATAWGLPAQLAAAIGGHHGPMTQPPDSPAAVTLLHVAHAADWAAALYREEAGPRDATQACEAMAIATGVTAERIGALLAELPAAVSSAAEAFGFEQVPDPGIESLLRDANLALIEENVSAQELNWRLQSALDERDASTARLRKELETARIVQRSLLPDGVAAKAEGVPFSGLNAPARELSGDFYDHFTLRDGRSCFCLADVSGKGMDAALLMAKTSGLFHCLGKLIHDPGKLLSLINAELVESSVRGMFVTMIAGVYDPVERAVSLVNAGHPPAVLFGARGDPEMLAVHGPPLGIVAGEAYEAERIEVGDRALYLFSDGIIEATDSTGDMLGYAGFSDVLRTLKSTPRPERPARILTGIGRTHELGGDDVTLLVLES